MSGKIILLFMSVLCLAGCGGHAKEKQLELAVRDRENEKGHLIESFEIKKHKEKSPQSHTFYYEAHVIDTVSKKELVIKDSVWLYQRNDSTWTVVPR
jgi:hypothetical protein